MQHARLPSPSPTPRASSYTCPWSRWCHPTISSSVVPFSFCLQSFPAPGSFLVSQFYIRWPKYWSFSLSICPSNEYSGLISFRIDWFALFEVQGTLGKYIHLNIYLCKICLFNFSLYSIATNLWHETIYLNHCDNMKRMIQQNLEYRYLEFKITL